MFDLAKKDPSLVAEAGYEFVLELPDGTPTDAKIKVRGAMSKIVQNYSRQVYREMQMKEKVNSRKGKPADEPSLEELEEMASRNAAVRVISWSNIGEDGKEIPFSKENAEDLFKRYGWIRQQVLEASDDLTNFRQR